MAQTQIIKNRKSNNSMNKNSKKILKKSFKSSNKESMIESMKKDLEKNKEEVKIIKKKYERANTIKDLTSKKEKINSDSSISSNISVKSNKSFDGRKKTLTLKPEIQTIRRIPSDKYLFTPMPRTSIIAISPEADKIRRINKMLRREEYNVQLKKTNITKLFGKRLIFIQRFWRKWFKNVYLKKTIKIQSVYKGHFIRKGIKSDRLIVIRLVVKLCLEGRRFHFYFFIGQIRKLIRAIFFQNMINTNDISIQVDIPYNINKNIESNNIKVEEINYVEGDLERLSKLLGQGNINGLKSFPRPYCEVGINFKVFRKKNVRENNQIDINKTQEYDMKYSGKTSQLIIDIKNKKIVLNKFQNNEIVAQRKNYIGNNNNKIIKFNEEQLEEELGEKKTFLKSKNIIAQEFDVLKSDKYVNLIRKKIIYNKWNFYTKESHYKLEENKKRLEERVIQEKNEEIMIKFTTKTKLFIMLIKECLIKHIRKDTLNLLYPIELRLEKKLKSYQKKGNSFFGLRRTAEFNENISKSSKNILCDSTINNGSSSIIFNDETIFIYINQSGFNNEILKKYELTPHELSIYIQTQNKNK